MLFIRNDMQAQKHQNKCFLETHSKKGWVVLTHFWVKYGQTQPLG